MSLQFLICCLPAWFKMASEAQSLVIVYLCLWHLIVEYSEIFSVLSVAHHITLRSVLDIFKLVADSRILRSIWVIDDLSHRFIPFQRLQNVAWWSLLLPAQNRWRYFLTKMIRFKYFPNKWCLVPDANTFFEKNT